MASTFFENQIRARRNTGFLVALYSAAVVLIVLAVYLAASLLLLASYKGDSAQNLYLHSAAALWNPRWFAVIAGLTLALIAGGTLFKTIQLSQGGQAVARWLGGRLVSADTGDSDERKILNVVEEMSIASGVPVPPVYVLDEEDSINAFAAGFTTRDAVVGVTAGCIRELNRDELQGVVAHEFSHILNGDMRLNIRLMSVLHGIILIALTGRIIWRLTARSSSRRSSGGSKKGGAGAIVLLALALIIIGYIGAFFAALIKSAVSRQREFLADASAVQFTRNPLGIGGALKKIGGLPAKSRLENPLAEEASHFFFANALRSAFFGLLATHPPLEERIRRIDPAFRGRLAAKAAPPRTPAARPAGMPFPPAKEMTAGASGLNSLAENVGQAGPQHVKAAHDFLGNLPAPFIKLLHEPNGARLIVYTLLLNREEETRQKQLAYLEQHLSSMHWHILQRNIAQIASLGLNYRLPLASVALNALRLLPPGEYRRFRETTQFLIEADLRCSIFEYALQRMLRRSLDAYFFPAGVKPASRTLSSEAAARNAAILLTVLARLTSANSRQMLQGLQAGFEILELPSDYKPKELDVSGLQALDQALTALENAHPRFKEKILKASVALIKADREVSIEEFEMLRAIAEGLDCPVPPLLLEAE